MLNSALKSRFGFTLIELLVTVTIIGILAAAGTVVYSSAQQSSRIGKRIQDLKALQTALELYKNNTGNYPNQDAWGCIPSVLAPTYMPALPADPLAAGNAADATYCYQYKANSVAASSINATEYKVRTNTGLWASTGGEMNTKHFMQQSNMIDPAQDADVTSDLKKCSIETASGAGPLKAWALYSGTTACTY